MGVLRFTGLKPGANFLLWLRSNKLKFELQTTVHPSTLSVREALSFVVQASACPVVTIIKTCLSSKSQKVSDIRLQPGEAQNAHFLLFRRADAAEERDKGQPSSNISALKNGANENQ